MIDLYIFYLCVCISRIIRKVVDRLLWNSENGFIAAGNLLDFGHLKFILLRHISDFCYTS